MSIFLAGTDILQVVLDAAPATNQLPLHASWVDQGGAGGNEPLLTNGTTPITLVPSPPSGVERLVSQISIPNADTATRTVTVNIVRSGTPFRLCKVALLAGYQLFYDGQWRVLDASGNFLSLVTVSGGTLTANQGTAAAITGPWPVELSNGTVAVGTASAPLRVDPTGTTTQPVSIASFPALQNVNLTEVDGVALGAPVAYGSTPTGNAISVNAFVTNGGSGGASNITQWNSVALGSPSNYGTSPGAVDVIGTNAFVTNTVTVNDTTGNLSQASTTASQLGTLAQGAATTSAPSYATGKTNPLSLNLAGGLRVDGSGVTQPISGTVTTTPPSNASTNLTQLAGSTLGAPSNYGTSPGAVEVQGVNAFVTNPVAVTGTFFQTTQPVSGTVTANQGTSPWVVSLTSTTITGTVAVTQSTNPWTVQGDSASGAANAGNPVKIGAVFNTTQPTVTTGQTVDAQSTARGGLIVATGVDTFNTTVTNQLWATAIGGVQVTSTTPVNFGAAANTRIRQIYILNNLAVAASGGTNLIITDGLGNVRASIGITANSLVMSTSAFTAFDLSNLDIPLTNGSNSPNVKLSNALTGGSIILAVSLF
jgi:hypothetical protein